MRISRDFIELLMQKYERYIAPFTFALGFLLDTFTLTRVDFWIDHLVLLGYLALAGGGIAFFYAYEEGRMRFRFMEWGIAFVPLVIQFAFGGLFSAFVIFYTTSASFGRHWLFLFALAAILVGNERFRKRYERFLFQTSIFFIAVFSYFIFLVPILTGSIGTREFFLSGIASIGFIALFLFALSRVRPRKKESVSFGEGSIEYKNALRLFWSIGTLFIFFNLLYLSNVIPPIPLSLKESGVYHSVSRNQDGVYDLRFEPAPWYAPFRETARMFRWRSGQPVYYFTSVFAPARLTTPIVHRWSFYDEVQEEWSERGDIQFPIFGGRDRGYRGYSIKTAVEPGKWRVEVLTQNGQTLGQETFTVVLTLQEPKLARAFK